MSKTMHKLEWKVCCKQAQGLKHGNEKQRFVFILTWRLQNISTLSAQTADSKISNLIENRDFSSQLSILNQDRRTHWTFLWHTTLLDKNEAYMEKRKQTAVYLLSCLFLFSMEASSCALESVLWNWMHWSVVCRSANLHYLIERHP